MKAFRYLSALCLIAGALTACQNEEENLFGEQAAIRLNHTVTQYKDLLESAPNGWAISFFPKQTKLGGVSLTATFKDGKVTMMTNEAYDGDKAWMMDDGDAQTSLYRIFSEQTVLLSFDTYNPLFHYYSDPKGSGDIDGLESDFEFIFDKVGTDTIELRGKRFGTKMWMVRLKEDPITYLTNVETMKDMTAGMYRIRMTDAGKSYPIFMADRQLAYTLTDDQGQPVSGQTAFIYTESGIRLYEPIKLNGREIIEFTYNTTNKAFENGSTAIPYPTGLEQLTRPTAIWKFTIDEQHADPKFNSIYKIYAFKLKAMPNVTNIAQGVYWGNSPYMKDKKNDTAMGDDFYTSVIGVVLQQEYDFTAYITHGVDNSITPDGQLAIEAGQQGVYYPYFEPFFPIFDYVTANSPYIVTLDDDANPHHAKLVSAANPEVWFTLDRQ